MNGVEKDRVDEHVEQAVREMPFIDAEVEGAVSRVCKMTRYLDKSMGETLSAYDMTEGEYRVLIKIRLSGPEHHMSPGDLSRDLMVSTGAMTNRLDRMEEAGLVVRKRDPDDRRGVLVELTDVGRKVLGEALGEQAAKEIDLLSVLNPREQITLNRLLRKLMRSFEQKMGPPPRRRPEPDAI